MTSAGTPSHKYKWKTPKEMKKQSYEIRLRAQFGTAEDKKKLAAYNRRRKERQMEASNKDYFILGLARNRYWVMEYVISEVGAGRSLVEVCKTEGMPSIQQVYAWRRCHPDFAKALQEAEEVRGHILGEQALEIALNTDRENVAADKLKVEVLSKFAARANAQFQDKTVQQNVDELSTLTADQIRERIKAMTMANPELKALISESVPTVAETPLPSLTFVEAEIHREESQSPDEDAG